MIAQHAQILVVILPLLCAPLVLLLGKSRIAVWFTVGVLSVNALLTWWLLLQVLTIGTLRYSLGNWPAPWGIEYRLDPLGALLQVMIASIAAVMAPFLRKLLAEEIGSSRQYAALVAFILLTAGLLGIVATGDAFNVFVFLEISSLSTYALIAIADKRDALLASFRYLIVGTIGATFFLIGIGLVYILTGTLNMDDLAVRLPEVSHTNTTQIALIFVTIGIAIKAAIWPLHAWLIPCYSYAPRGIVAFLAALSTKVALYALARFLFGVFPLADMPIGSVLLEILQLLAIAAMLIGSAAAIAHSNVRAVLAYSSVAQIGYITLGLALATSAGVTAAIIHMFNHAFIKGSLFMCIAILATGSGKHALESLKGLGHRMPIVGIALLIGGFSLVGVPLTSGFISKWFLITALVQAEKWIWIVAVLLSSVMSIIYVWKIVEAVFDKSDDKQVRSYDLSVDIPIVLLAAVSLYIGINSSALVSTAEQASKWLLGMP
ncbi:MAG: hypothetical protein RL336_1543 [Pseudomonadota bacterium]